MSGLTSSATWVKGLAEMLNASGLDARALFNEAGLDIAALNQAGARYPSRNINILWELAAKRSNNPAIALVMAQSAEPGIFDVVAYAMMSCPNLLGGLERLACYMRILCNAARLEVVQSEHGCWLTLEYFGDGQLIPRQRFEFSLLIGLNFCRWLTQQDLGPLAVEFAHPEPIMLQPYVDGFKCPIRFGAVSNRLLFSTADLALPLPTSNPVLAELHNRYAGEYLERLDNAGISYKTREMIVRMLPDGEPRREDIASALCMSERTLQRRLHDEDTSFNQLVDDTRHDLAKRYLVQQHMTLEQAAYLLGFTDHSNFSRACKRWFDMPPGKYRISIQGSASNHHPKSDDESF